MCEPSTQFNFFIKIVIHNLFSPDKTKSMMLINTSLAHYRVLKNLHIKKLLEIIKKIIKIRFEKYELLEISKFFFRNLVK